MLTVKEAKARGDKLRNAAMALQEMADMIADELLDLAGEYKDLEGEKEALRDELDAALATAS